MGGLTDGVVGDALRWFNDPLVWQGPNGIVTRTVEHVGMSLAAVLLASVVALPLGIWLGHRGRGGNGLVVAVNTSRALPTVALLYIFASTGVGFGNRPAVIAAAVFALPPVLANAWTGVREVDRATREAARGMGMSDLRVLTRVELPLAMPLIAAGLRTATVQVVATVALAALVGGGGLGRFIVDGFATRRFGPVLGGAVLVAVLALLAEAVLAAVQRSLTPAPLRVAAARS
jgi:osmoprotectant transport system permease protein